MNTLLVWGIVFVLIFICAEKNSCSLFDPHLYPKEGPFFEGWYIRISDIRNHERLGVLFGRVLPYEQSDTHPLVVCSILYMNCSDNCRLISFDESFNASHVDVTVRNLPVTRDPDKESASDFQWSAYSSSSFCTFRQADNTTEIFFKLKNASLRVLVGNPVPWGPNGEGPEGWIDTLKFLPLHWFVFSLRSPVIYYEFVDLNNHNKVSGHNVVAHMEKNWGKSFPASWIWSEGVGANNVSYALSGGPVHMAGLDITAYLIGYRNPAKGIVLNYRPGDNILTVDHNGCDGSINITAHGLMHDLHIAVTARLSTFSDCLLGPEVNGFRKACMESYNASTTIHVFERHLSGSILIDQQIIFQTALEFGGEFTCHGKCVGYM